MELLESVGPRPRQARYQAALRPDICCAEILLHFWIFHSFISSRLCASDVAISTSFGMANLTRFSVFSEELIQWIARPAWDSGGFHLVGSHIHFVSGARKWRGSLKFCNSR